MSQLPLPLSYLEARGAADFFISEANREAVRHLERARAWPVPVTLLLGPPASGKTHLLQMFAARTGGRTLDDLGPGLDEEALFHAWNAAAPGRPLLLAARSEPGGWGLRLPDLASRLAATPRASIAPPDDALLAAVMRKRFRDLGLEVGPDVVAFVLARLERGFEAVAAAVMALDAAALAGRRPVTVPLARETLFAETKLL